MKNYLTKQGALPEDLRDDEVGDVVEVPGHHEDVWGAVYLIRLGPRLAQELSATVGFLLFLSISLHVLLSVSQAR